MTGNKQQAQNTGQGLSPAPQQMEHPENGNSNSFSVNRSDSIRLRGLGADNRKTDVKPNDMANDMAAVDSDCNVDGLLSDNRNRQIYGGLNEQNTDADSDNGRNYPESDNSQDSGRNNRESDEVKHEKTNAKTTRNSGIDSADSGDDLRPLPAESFSDARFALPVNQASFDAGNADSPPVGKKSKPRKKRELFNLPTSGQDDLKSLMPSLPSGYWFECPADDRGFKIKLRWRAGESKGSHVFARVGKYEFQTWKEMKTNERKWTIKDRLTGELIGKGKQELADRIGFTVINNRKFSEKASTKKL